MNRIILFVLLLAIAGCAAPKSREHRTILEWQAEGHHTYRVEDGVEYFVKCEAGLKYIGVSVPATATQDGYYTVRGPIDVCTGEEK